MAESDVCINTLRVTLFIEPALAKQRNIEYQFINKEQLLSVLQTAKNNVAITRNIIIDKVVLNLGAMPRQHLSLYFYQRLHAALVQLFTQLASRARNTTSTGGGVTGTAAGQRGSLVAQAIDCLQSAGAKTDVWRPQTQRAAPARQGRHSHYRATQPGWPDTPHSRHHNTHRDATYVPHARRRETPPEALYHAFTRGVNDYFAASVGSSPYNAILSAHPTVSSPAWWPESHPGTASTRLTPLRLVQQALSYLLTVAEGRHWLSQHSMTHAQRDAWAAALVQQEIPLTQFLQLVALLESLPIAQARAIAGRWVIPLWRYAGMAKTVQLHAGNAAQQQIDDYLASLLPETLAAARSHRADKPDGNLPTSGLAQQRRETLAARQRARRADDESPLGLPVSNAGVVLLWPLLPQWFTALGLVAEKQFISDDARWQAVAAIDWLVWEAERPQAQRVVVNQFLCGLPLEEPPIMPEPLSAQQQQITSEWASSVFSQIAAFEKMGLTDIRQLFLQRPGELFADVTPAVLHIQPEVFDILLTKWSWPLNLAFFPWFDAPLLLEWLPGDPGRMLP
ncbi:contractile injection system tape measure protein [Kosakonia oryzendophytica]|uniref:contractile injection system tape measure protein n=1 Tax=Kosakonia oryzendophytica TaxID=1005665 RepID=UPI003D34AEBC